MSFLSTLNVRKEIRHKLEQYFDKYLSSEMIVYDIGCGSKPFAKYLQKKVHAHIGVDIEDCFYDKSSVDLIGTAYDVPAPSNSADAIISSQVMEHLDSTQRAFLEIERLLKPEGLLFISSPFLYPIHAEPRDYNRLTEYSLISNLKEHNFELLSMQRIGGFWYIAGIFLCIYLQPIDNGFLKKIKVSTFILIFVRWFFAQLHNLEGIFIKLLGKDPELHRQKWTTNYVLVARKLDNVSAHSDL